jgi:hypothetical protein
MTPVQNLRVVIATTLAVSSFYFSATSQVSAAPRIFSGEYEYGEKYTDVYVPPDVIDAARDDESFDRYVFRNSWLQYEQPIKETTRVSIRAQRLERDYADRPTLNNETHYGQVRVSLEPAENWAVWPHVSLRMRDYENDALDNEIWLAGVESRYRWGVRDNIRMGVAYTRTDYENDPAREREQTSAFASVEKPLRGDFTIRVGARVEQTSFNVQSATRENAARASGSVGFRYEF